MSLFFLTLLAGCPSQSADSALCTPLSLVATDIDETLTTANEEFLAQMADPKHDPAMRPDADTLMQGYADRGYTILYVTGRWADGKLGNGESYLDATARWLQEHAFPYAAENLYLSPEDGLDSDELQAFKAGVLTARMAEGWTVDWAYGNSESDIEAFLEAGVPADHVFLVGELAGEMDVEGVPDSRAYTAHVEAQLPAVDEAPCP